MVIKKTVINDMFFKSLPNLMAVVRYGIGYDNIDLESATKYRIAVAVVCLDFERWSHSGGATNRRSHP